jgi:uncharacterized low-complexity protein
MSKPIHSLAVAASLLGLALVQPAAAKPRTIDNAELKYSVTVPGECRTEEGPGTLEAICSPDFDEAKSAELSAAGALLLEVDAEAVPADAKPYGETEFRQEVPEAVCGESDTAKVKLVDVKTTKDGAATVLTAAVTCPEIKFLGLGERQAQVRYVMQPGLRYRLMARVLTSDAGKVKAATESFFTSFKTTGGAKP